MTGLTITVVESDEDLNAAFAIRRDVFCLEQGVAEADEIDGLDPVCRHYLARLDGAPVGTARTRPVVPGDTKIERVAVIRRLRRTGIGKALMARVLADLPDGRAVLNAQLAVKEFYAGLGFLAEGDIFREAGIDHVRMIKAL